MIHFTVQGKSYEIEQERLSIAEAMEIKQATGLTVRAFLNGLKEYDVDALVALVWLARSRAGEQVSIKQIVASNFDLLADFELERPNQDEDQDEDQDEGEPVPTQGLDGPPTTPTSTSATPPSTPSTRTSTGRTGSARSRALSATPPSRSTR